MPFAPPFSRNIRELMLLALREDGASSDITARLCYAPRQTLRARLVARQAGVVAGLPFVRQVFLAVDPSIRCVLRVQDGAAVRRGTALADVSGPARSVMAAERTALNLLGRLSGVATLTAQFVRAARGTRVRIYDTRKTTPGLRALEKYAVRCGGGQNHRMHLREQALVKKNHLAGCGDLEALGEHLRHVKRRLPRGVALEVEITSPAQLDVVLAVRPDIVMLDNFSLKAMRTVMQRVRRRRRSERPAIEVSGGVTLRNVKSVAGLGVDRIAVGALTHSAPWLDVALEVIANGP